MPLQIKLSHFDLELEHRFNEVHLNIFLFILKLNIAYAVEKIAFIDLNYIMNNSLSGKSINNFINNLKDKKIEDFNKIESKIKKMKMILFQKKILLLKIYIMKKLVSSSLE